MIEYLKTILVSAKSIINSQNLRDLKLIEKQNNNRENKLYNDKEKEEENEKNMDIEDLFKDSNNFSENFILDYSKMIPKLGVVFVADITNENSLNEILGFIKKLREYEKSEVYKTEKIILFNKYDKLLDFKKISNINSKLESLGISYFYCSALNGWNIKEAITELIVQLRKNYLLYG